MGNLTVSLEKGVEMQIRLIAREKYGGRKGSIGKVIEEAVEKLAEDSKREKARQRLSKLMDRGFDMGKITVKSRDEIYDRFDRRK
ncbi:MAG: hypothetical protein V1494_05805 [Candidatus Diapherotrites archaeon]